MNDTHDQFFLGRAYFYGVDGDAMGLEQILYGARYGFEETPYRLLFLRATVEARFAVFLAAGGGASTGTEHLLEAIDEAIAALPGDVERFNRAAELRKQARRELALAALGPVADSPPRVRPSHDDRP